MLYPQALAGTVGMSAVAPRQHQGCTLACASGLVEEVGVYLRSCLNPHCSKVSQEMLSLCREAHIGGSLYTQSSCRESVIPCSSTQVGVHSQQTAPL